MHHVVTCRFENELSPADVAILCAALGRLAASAAAAAAATGDASTPQTLQAIISKHQAGMSLRQLSDSLWGLGKAGLQVEGRWVGKVWGTMLQKSKQVGEHKDVFTERNSGLCSLRA
jgi:hypothetical protein